MNKTIETVTIPKKLWVDMLESQPWMIRKAAETVVVSEGVATQLAWWVKAGVAIGAVWLVVKYGGKVLKV